LEVVLAEMAELGAATNRSRAELAKQVAKGLGRAYHRSDPDFSSSLGSMNCRQTKEKPRYLVAVLAS
jgi:hypothetical protein